MALVCGEVRFVALQKQSATDKAAATSATRQVAAVRRQLADTERQLADTKAAAKGDADAASTRAADAQNASAAAHRHAAALKQMLDAVTLVGIDLLMVLLCNSRAVSGIPC